MKCTGNNIKSSVGNTTYCADSCDGPSTVPNVGHTACGKMFNLSFRKKNNINNRAISPNSCFHYFSVLLLKYNSAVYLCCLHYGFTHIHTTLSFTECNAGYYRISGICLLCPGYKIKTMTGDKSHCDEDTACDGITKIPNRGHTACGRFLCFSSFV